VLETDLDEMGIATTDEEKDQSNLNDLVTDRQRAITFTWTSAVNGYESWMKDKALRAMQRTVIEAETKKLAEQKKAEAAEAEEKKRVQIEAERERRQKIEHCRGTIRLPAPKPQIPVLNDVQCFFHRCWRGTWEETGLTDAWHQCAMCHYWFCPSCGDEGSVTYVSVLGLTFYR
jgi:hypothetical protein